MSEKGCPVIYLVPEASKVTVDGKALDAKSYSEARDPSGSSSERIINAELTPGKHRVEIEYTLDNGVRFSGDSVELRTNKSDLSDRRFDEQYFPSNLEYDQYPGKVSFEIRGSDVKHRLMSNGDVSDDSGELVVNFPPTFNTSSRFIDIINPADYVITEDTFASMKGSVPMTLYTPGNVQIQKPNLGWDMSAQAIAARAIEVAKTALAKHEKDFGPYPHPRVLIRISGTGGMEYSGATECSLKALPHELHHQWFARSAQPANGNAGWIDEACASWHDKGYPTTKSEPSSGQQLAGFSPWQRSTPRAAYSHGADIMAYLDSVFAPKGGLRPVLAKFSQTYQTHTFTTENFIDFVKSAGSDLKFDFEAFFKAQVYAKGLAMNPAQSPRFAAVRSKGRVVR